MFCIQLEEFKSIPDENAKELQQLQKKKDDLEVFTYMYIYYSFGNLTLE